MKKYLLLLLLVIGVLVLAACGNGPVVDDPVIDDTPDEPVMSQTYELALITDTGTINDNSFNQGSWEGVKKYGDENQLAYNYYQPAQVSTEAYGKAIDTAVADGAKIVVCPGYLFEVAVYEAQYKYPEVKFIIIDGEPRTADYKTEAIESNVQAIFFAEQEAGFLAGYSAVKNGFTRLGFIGGASVNNAVVRYGYGYIKGAEYAARELELTGLTMNYYYDFVGNFAPSDEVETLSALWYNSGVEVIFACGGGMGSSVMAAAEAAGTYVIGVDIDQSTVSSSVIVSAIKNLTTAVYDSIAAYYNEEFPGGKITTLNAATGGIGLSMQSSKYENFSMDDYNAIFDKLIVGGIAIPTDEDAKSPVELSSDVLTVTLSE